MKIRDILKAKKEVEIPSNRNEVLGKKQFNGNFIATKIKKEKVNKEKEVA